MRKMITLLAATSLVATSFAFADTQTPGNSNDVLQQIPAHQDANQQGITIADADTSASPAPAATDDTKTVVVKKHHRHHMKKMHHPRHHHHHHHKAPYKSTNDTAPAPEAAAPETAAPSATPSAE